MTVTDLLITGGGDAWVNSLKPSLNYGSTTWVFVKSGERRGFVRPPIDSIAGRTVLAATFSVRVGTGGIAAQTLTFAPVTERWSPGRVTWANQPAANTAAQVTAAVGALPAGSVIEVNVLAIIQAVADGTAWNGLRITTNSTAAGQKFYATDSGEPAWELAITLSDEADPPTDLRPDGGGAVSTGEPWLAWQAGVFDLTPQAESRVQVDTPAAGVDPDETTPDFDSGWVVNVDPQYNLAAATYTPPASPPGSTFWRVATDRDAAGNPIWSDWAEFTVAALPTPVVDSPTGPFGDPSPTLLVHLTGGTVKSWWARATGPDRSDIRAETGTRTGPVDWQIPTRNADGRRVLTEDRPGWIYYRIFDTVDRAVAVGEKAYVDGWILADLTDDGTIDPPTGLTVTQLAEYDPRNRWVWSRTEAADAWLIEVDGVTLERLEPEDVTLSAGRYTWIDSGQLSPLRPHTLRVRAVEDTDKSKGATVTRSHEVRGVWLLPTDADPVKLQGRAVAGFTRTDRVATYTPLVGPDVDLIYDRLGRTGTFEGGIDVEGQGGTDEVWAALDTIEALRKSPTRKARMVWGSQSILVRLRDPDATSHDEITPAKLQHAVRFGFVQVGE